MPLRATVIGDHSGNRDARLEGGESVHQRRQAARHAMYIGHQQHRSRQPVRNLRRAAAQRSLVRTVEQAHHAFHHRDVHVLADAAEQFAHIGFAGHPTIQVVTGAARGKC